MKITQAECRAEDRFLCFCPVEGCLAIVRSRLAGIRHGESRLGSESFVEFRVEVHSAMGHL